MKTPWGDSDSRYRLADGVVEVGTPSHGGIMVREDVSGFLSAEARQIGEPFGPWLAFEEDCAFAAVYASKPELWRQAVKVAGVGLYSAPDINSPDATDEAIRAAMLEIAHTWYPEVYNVPCRFCERGQCYRHKKERAL